MKEVFRFTSEEVIEILYFELVRLGKVEDGKPCGIITACDFGYGKLNSITVEISDPIPGAPDITPRKSL